jgi:hypothetical protein
VKHLIVEKKNTLQSCGYKILSESFLLIFPEKILGWPSSTQCNVYGFFVIITSGKLEANKVKQLW